MFPTYTFAVLTLTFAVSHAFAQHNDILVQQSSGKLVVGVIDYDAGDSQSERVFTSRLPSIYTDNNPGFNALPSSSPSLPPGTQALPGSSDLDWDFLPMRGACATSNLLYWDGQGSTLADVAFGAPPTDDYRMYLYGRNNQVAAVDGTPTMVPGHTIDRTGSNGFIHEHLFFYLDDDTDVINGSAPAEGYYLISMQVRMEGLETSDPFYILWSTPGASTLALEQLARPWVNARLDLLHSDVLAGDYNADGAVDAADYTVWRDTLGSTTRLAADGNFNLVVDEADLDCWRMNFGQPLAGAAVTAAPVPEPGAGVLAVLLAGGVMVAARASRPSAGERRYAAARV